MTNIQHMFSDPQAVARYTEGPPRLVPGYNAMLSMAAILLAERAREEARILVLGAGGGLELRTFAQAQPGWRFDGVDPSAAMLDLAKQTLGPLAPRARLHQGYIDDAPEGPFDGASCLLTLHFVDVAERRRIASEIRRRLKPGAAFVAAHLSAPNGEEERPVWLSRYSAFLAASGVQPEQAAAARNAVTNHLESSHPHRTRRSCARPASPSRRCSTPASPSAAGWPMREALRRSSRGCSIHIHAKADAPGVRT